MAVDRRAGARALLIVGLFAAGSAVAQSPTARTSEQASFRAEQSTLELGKVLAGETVTATFVFRNDGPEDVHIIRAKPS